MDPHKTLSSSTSSCVVAEVVSSTAATSAATNPATTKSSSSSSSSAGKQPPRKGPRSYPPGKGKSIDELFEDIARGLERWEKRLPPHERSRSTSQFNSAKAKAARKKASEEANRKDPNRIQYGWQLRDQLLNSTYVPPEPPKPPPKQLKFEPSRFTFNPGDVAVSSNNDGTTTKEVDMMDNDNNKTSTDDADADADAQNKKQGACKFGSQHEGSYIDGTYRNPMEEDDEEEDEASVNVKKKKSIGDPLFADLFTSPSAKAAAKRYTVGSNSAAIYEKIKKEAEEKKRKEREEREKNKVDPIEAFKEKARKNGTSGYCPFPIYGYNMFGQPKCSPEDAERLAAFAKKWIATPIPGERKKSTEAEQDNAAKSEEHE